VTSVNPLLRVLPQVLLFRGCCNCGLEGEIIYRSKF